MYRIGRKHIKSMQDPQLYAGHIMFYNKKILQGFNESPKQGLNEWIIYYIQRIQKVFRVYLEKTFCYSTVSFCSIYKNIPQ